MQLWFPVSINRFFGFDAGKCLPFYGKINHCTFHEPQMKRNLAITFLFCLPVLLNAQKSSLDEERENFFRGGFKAGLNMGKVKGASFTSGFQYNYQAGAFLQFNFSSRFGIQPEVSFVQQSAEFSDEVTIIYDDLFNGSQRKAKLNYLEIPVLLNINIGPSKRIKAQIGPAFGDLLKQTVDSLVTNTDLYKKTEWSMIGGIWIQLPLIHLGARFKQGLTNINAIDNRQSWKNQSFQFFLGLTF